MPNCCAVTPASRWTLMLLINVKCSTFFLGDVIQMCDVCSFLWPWNKPIDSSQPWGQWASYFLNVAWPEGQCDSVPAGPCFSKGDSPASAKQRAGQLQRFSGPVEKHSLRWGSCQVYHMNVHFPWRLVKQQQENKTNKNQVKRESEVILALGNCPRWWKLLSEVLKWVYMWGLYVNVHTDNMWPLWGWFMGSFLRYILAGGFK